MGMNMVGAFGGSAETTKGNIKPHRCQGDEGIVANFNKFLVESPVALF